MSQRMPVLMAAQAVALSARTNTLTAQAVEAMLARACEALAPVDELRAAVVTFAAAYERHRRDPEAMAVHGVTLEAEIREILKLNPAMPRTRVDIDG